VNLLSPGREQNKVYEEKMCWAYSAKESSLGEARGSHREGGENWRGRGKGQSGGGKFLPSPVLGHEGGSNNVWSNLLILTELSSDLSRIAGKKRGPRGGYLNEEDAVEWGGMRCISMVMSN